MFAVTYLHYFHNPSPHPLYHIQPIIAVADGSLTCSQHAPFSAHVSTVEWVTWADSRWCSLGGWDSVCLLSPLPAQYIFILLRSPLPQDQWRYSGPLLLCHHLPYMWMDRQTDRRRDVSVLSLELFIQGTSGCSLTCSWDGEPWGSS